MKEVNWLPENSLESSQEKNPAFSTRVLPELQNRLRDSGFLTAIVTVESPRFKHYLKKPANLLHDRWVYLERGRDRSVLYRLGTERGLRQDLTIHPLEQRAVIETYDPRLERKQTIVIDLGDKSVLSNTVDFELQEAPKAYFYYALGKFGGTLEPIEPVEEPDTEADSSTEEFVEHAQAVAV